MREEQFILIITYFASLFGDSHWMSERLASHCKIIPCASTDLANISVNSYSIDKS